tara:strand:+ start:2729 stop:2932 length:204 start_codon:yes stop_codon:yes gene_type:complete
MDNPFLPPSHSLEGIVQKHRVEKMVKESVVNFKDPELTEKLNLIESNRVNSLASLDRYLSKFLSFIF